MEPGVPTGDQRTSSKLRASACPRGFAMLVADVPGHHAQRRHQHQRVVGEAEHRQDVGHHIYRQHEIGERTQQRRLHLQRRLTVEGGVVGGEQVLRERQPGGDALQLRPEAAAHARLVTL